MATIVIREEVRNPEYLTHTAENGYECNDPDCICHWARRTQEQDYETGTHAPDCRCSWCEPQN